MLDSLGGSRSGGSWGKDIEHWETWGKDVEQPGDSDVIVQDGGWIDGQRWGSWEAWGEYVEQLCDVTEYDARLVDGQRTAPLGEDWGVEADFGGGGGGSLAVIDLVDGRHDLVGREDGTGKEAVGEDRDVDINTLSVGELAGVLVKEDGDEADGGWDNTKVDSGSRLADGMQQRSLEFASRLLSFFRCLDVEILNKKL